MSLCATWVVVVSVVVDVVEVVVGSMQCTVDTYEIAIVVVEVVNNCIGKYLKLNVHKT